jgi:hypothetical protein
MKRLSQVLPLGLVLGTAWVLHMTLLSSVSAQNQPAQTRAAAESRVLRHVVLFKFKSDATAAQIQQVVEAFRALPGKIPAIQSFEWGTDVSPEGKAQGFTHCFLVTFRTEADRDAYLPHPAHQEFVGVLRPILDDVLVVDYWTQS